jgi:hypothetical protein
MAISQMSERMAGEMNYGGFADAVGGIATVVLAIIGLTGIHSDILASIATIVFGAALLIQAGTMLSEYANVMYPTGGSEAASEFSGGSVAALFLVGAAGIVLGILALLGIYPMVLTSISAIAFGAGLVVSSNAVWHLQVLKRMSLISREAQDWRFGSQMLAGEMAVGSAGTQALAGLAALILGILAVVGTYPGYLTLVALLVVGATVVLTGSALSGAALGFMRPAVERTRTTATSATTAMGGV